MADTFRLYGPEIGMSTAVVDADVSGVSLGGDIEFTPQSGSASAFTLSPDRLRELVNENLAYDKDSIDPKAEVWKAIEDVETRYENADRNQDAFTAAARTLFTGAS